METVPRYMDEQTVRHLFPPVKTVLAAFKIYLPSGHEHKGLKGFWLFNYKEPKVPGPRDSSWYILSY